MSYKKIANINVHKDLYNFIDNEVITNLPINTHDFFTALAKISTLLSVENNNLLKERDNLQQQIDNWHKNNEFAVDKYKKFLTEISYIEKEVADFKVNLDKVDKELASIPAPQLVVPVSNARFAINAVNARFGSLYDALYGSNIIDNSGDTKITAGFINSKRAAAVIKLTNEFLDNTIAIANYSYNDVKSIMVTNNNLIFVTHNNAKTQLVKDKHFVGYSNNSILFSHNNLYIELVLDAKQKIKNVILEAAVSTIVDFEDSVATVSIAEKVHSYRNFLGLITKKLTANFYKNDKLVKRQLAADKIFTARNNDKLHIKATSLILVRNVGHHMRTNCITDDNNKPIFEGILDAFITVLISLHDKNNNSKVQNIYIVKPKMHGSKEVAFTTKLMALIEQELNLTPNTIKLGIMDEEKRTSVNLKSCIKAARNRIIFINTGFLDRTGDEIHTCMHAGAVERKNKIKQLKWINSYEDLNVATALSCGFHNQAQIGKGMWPEPDNMKSMLATKITHLKMGANCSWVPSPTAATLHAMHYHQVDVMKIQQQITIDNAKKDDLLHIPLLTTKPDKTQIKRELHNNAQGILGYVVKWIDQGIGCSKVNDINNIALMEDRATLRISSQHIANWLLHKICTKQEVIDAFKEMAVLVDKQNINDKNYLNMAPKYDGLAFNCALELVLAGISQPNGYTEYILTNYRSKKLLTTT